MPVGLGFERKWGERRADRDWFGVGEAGRVASCWGKAVFFALAAIHGRC